MAQFDAANIRNISLVRAAGAARAEHNEAAKGRCATRLSVALTPGTAFVVTYISFPAAREKYAANVHSVNSETPIQGAFAPPRRALKTRQIQGRQHHAVSAA
jgi:hypothetical protein